MCLLHDPSLPPSCTFVVRDFQSDPPFPSCLHSLRLQGMSMTIAALEQPGGSLASPFQAAPSALASHLLALLPALLVPCLAAAATSNLLQSVPVLLGAGAGAMAWSGAATLLTLASTASPHGLGLGMTAVCGGIGAGLAALAWASVGSAPSGGGGSSGGGGHGKEGASHLGQVSRVGLWFWVQGGGGPTPIGQVCEICVTQGARHHQCSYRENCLFSYSHPSPMRELSKHPSSHFFRLAAFLWARGQRTSCWGPRGGAACHGE